MWRQVYIGLLAGVVAIVVLSLVQRRGGQPKVTRTHLWGALPVGAPATGPASGAERTLRVYDVSDVMVAVMRQHQGTISAMRAGRQPLLVAAPTTGPALGTPVTAGIGWPATGSGVSQSLANAITFTRLGMQGGVPMSDEMQFAQGLIQAFIEQESIRSRRSMQMPRIRFWSGRMLAQLSKAEHENLADMLEQLRKLDEQEKGRR